MQLAGLVPHEVRDGDPAQVVDETRGPQRRALFLAEAERGGGLLGQRRHAARVAEQVGRLDVDEPRQRGGELVQSRRRHGRRRARLGVEDRVPHRAGLELVERPGGAPLECRGRRGIEPAGGTAADHRARRRPPRGAVEDLDLVGERDHARRRLDLLAGKPARHSLPVPARVHLADDRRHLLAEPAAPREAGGRLAVRLERVGLKAPAGAEVLERRLHAAGRRRAPGGRADRAQRLHGPGGVDRRERRDARELARAEQARGLRGEGRAARRVHEPGVEDIAKLTLAQAELVRDPQRDEAGPQRLLLRKAAPEVGGERDCGEQLRQPDPLPASCRGHARRVHRPMLTARMAAGRALVTRRTR